MAQELLDRRRSVFAPSEKRVRPLYKSKPMKAQSAKMDARADGAIDINVESRDVLPLSSTSFRFRYAKQAEGAGIHWRGSKDLRIRIQQGGGRL